MVKAGNDLVALERLARIRAEQELKKFAAFNQHMTALRNRVTQSERVLEDSYKSLAPLSVPEARMANAQAARAAREYQHAKREIEQISPRFEEMRLMASREFGRAEVLLELSRQQKKEREKNLNTEFW